MTHNAGRLYAVPETKRFQFGTVSLDLPRLDLGDCSIYVLNTLGGDPMLTAQLANELYFELTNFKYYEGFITPEGKALPLVYQVAKQAMRPFYVLRKSQKAYMGSNPISQRLETITSGDQHLFLDEKDRYALGGKRWLFVDDVISSGATLNAAVQIVEKAYGTVIGALALAIEGDYQPVLPTYYLAKLPIERKEDATS